MSEQDMIDKVILFDVLVRKFTKEITELNRNQNGITLKNPMEHDSIFELFNTTDEFTVKKGDIERYFVTNKHMNHTSYIPSHIMEENDISKFTESVRAFCYGIYLKNLRVDKNKRKLTVVKETNKIKEVDYRINSIKKFLAEGTIDND